jgi:hypothetical protein
MSKLLTAAAVGVGWFVGVFTVFYLVVNSKEHRQRMVAFVAEAEMKNRLEEQDSVETEFW